MNDPPLAEKLRPKNLNDVIGQAGLVNKGKIIHQIIDSGNPVSLILWGPPGSGKTTLARLIAESLNVKFIELSAVTSGKADVIRVVTEATKNKTVGIKTILFIDEIHRFNKAQQDAFLPYVENGTIYLIGATTENPSFEIIRPLLSRTRVLVLEPLTKDEIVQIINRALKIEKVSSKRLPKSSVAYLAELSGGDARIALGNLELALNLTEGEITKEVLSLAAQKRIPGYDKSGDNHYNLISAFIKSMRGSDVNASLYYLARILQAGEDPKFIARRMVIFASEDVGMSAPAALNLAVSTFQAVERIGMPECQYALFHCATVLCKTNKSRAIADSLQRAQSIAKEYPDLAVPLHLRNASTKLMKDLGYGEGTEWKAGFVHPKGFMPKEIDNLDIYLED
jgi:putative ATPase